MVIVVALGSAAMGGPLCGKAVVGARGARKGAAAAATGNRSPPRMKRPLQDLATDTSTSVESADESPTGDMEATGAMEAVVQLDMSDVVVISIDGNIGAGKSTLLEAVRTAMPEVEVVVEPVAEWENLKTADGKSLLAHFYDDSKRWGYTFQNCAILTRIIALKNAIKTTKKRVIVTERSVMTDRYVFAEMNRDCGNINELEWDLYMKWFDNFAADLPVKGVIHVTTDVKTRCHRPHSISAAAQLPPLLSLYPSAANTLSLSLSLHTHTHKCGSHPDARTCRRGRDPHGLPHLTRRTTLQVA